MGGGSFASRERLNLNSRKSKKNIGSKNQKSEKSQKQNLYLAKNSKKSEKNSLEKNLKISESKFSRKFYSRFFSKILNELDCFQQNLKNSNHGTILIEFAFCVPVLILLLLYINDIMILARTQDEMKRAAYCAVQLIQNVSKNRPIENRKITKKDILNIVYAWTIMVPIAQKAIVTVTPKGWSSIMTITLVEGRAQDKCKVKWLMGARHGPDWCGASTYNYGITNWLCSSLSTLYGKTIKRNEEVTSTVLFPDLHIKQGEIKVIIELVLEDAAKDVTSKMLGLHILEARTPYNSSGGCIYFPTHVIFTPINGIFDKDNPPK